tara:strand:+ start:636 stop:842 length:207 start_codon:yes stop_codon:yes gene_type:complete
MMDRTDIRKEKIIKNESLIKVNINKVMLKIDTLEKVVLNLLIFIIKRKRVRRKMILRALKVVRKMGSV